MTAESFLQFQRHQGGVEGEVGINAANADGQQTDEREAIWECGSMLQDADLLYRTDQFKKTVS